jgi:hypothetical protein
MKRLLLFLPATVLFFIAGSAAWYISRLHSSGKPVSHASTANPGDKKSKEKTRNIAFTARQFCSAHSFNTKICFLIDMSIESGRARFFVYDMRADSVLITGLVTHGRCSQNWLTGRKYGNTVGCGCTSLGKYRIGNSYSGKFGLAYKLYGLDSSNSNAYNRFVVLHSMQCVPENEVSPYPICQSDGCPTVSPGFLKELAAVIDAGNHPVLLWIYD